MRGLFLRETSIPWLAFAEIKEDIGKLWPCDFIVLNCHANRMLEMALSGPEIRNGYYLKWFKVHKEGESV